MSPDMRVRRMAEADVDAVLALAADLPSAPQWSRETYLAALHLRASPARVALIAETAETALVGFAIALVIPPEAELESIAVAGVFQRIGVAKRLFEELKGELTAAGVTHVLLEVRASNISALSLYRELGFSETGWRAGYYAHPMEDAVQMRLGIG